MNMQQLEVVQENTYNEMVSVLFDRGICNMVRPVGFGKTYLLGRLVDGFMWSRVVYFYPNSVVRMQSIRDVCSGKVLYVSYNRFARSVGNISNGQFLAELGISETSDILFIFDESTYVGGEKTSIAFKELYDTYGSDNYFVGSTANAIRDGGSVDITERYFGGNGLAYYDVNMGMRDGIYSPIKYYLCSFLMRDGLVERLESQDSWKGMSEESRGKYREFLKNRVVGASTFTGADRVYRKGVEASVPVERRSYMRFIAYFYSKGIMDAQCTAMVDDFRQAFPDKGVVVHRVISKEDVQELYKLKPVSGRIDIIANSGMVQFGYHDTELTGVIMFRSTDSDIVYGQSSLRGLSVMNEWGTLIFDMVGNSTKARERYFKGEKIPIIRIPNSGGSGYIDAENIELYSTEEDVNALYNVVELDRIKKAFKLEKLIKVGIIPIEVACRELGLKDSDLYAGFMKSIEGMRDLIA